MQDETQLPSSPLLPSALQAAVEAHLVGEGWEYTVEPSQSGVKTVTRLWNSKVTFRLEYSTHEKRGRVLLELIPDLVVPERARKEVALLLNWVDAYLHCTTFHLVPGRSEVRLRICLAGDFGQRVDAESVAHVTGVAVQIASGYVPLIREVALGRSTAEQILPRLADPWN